MLAEDFTNSAFAAFCTSSLVNLGQGWVSRWQLRPAQRISLSFQDSAMKRDRLSVQTDKSGPLRIQMNGTRLG